MSQPSAPERLAAQLPSRGARRVLSRLEVMRARREAGELCRVLVDAEGRLTLVVPEEFRWVEETRAGDLTAVRE